MHGSDKRNKKQIRIDDIALKMRMLSMYPERLGNCESDLIFVLNELARAESVLDKLLEIKKQLPSEAINVLMKWYGMEGYVE
jgi:hypothetical protein